MPRPLGSDRLEAASGGHLVLLSAHDKSWKPRLASTRLTPEHPGTAVRWEEQLFEVLDVEAAEGAVRYTLALWDERHAIRVAESYDEASEARRQKAQEAHARRERHRGAGLLLAPLLGCLPGRVQEELENEYAIPATRLTLFSAVPLLLFGAFSLIAMLVVAFGGPALLPLPLILVGMYLWFESLGRLAVAMGQERPIGSLPGEIVWEVWRILRRERRVETPAPLREPPPPEQASRDSFHVLEPALSFLEVRDQKRLRELFAFDGVRWGRITAIVILIGVGPMFLAAILGAAIALEPSDLVLLLVTGGLVIEQIFRLRKVARGEVAPSVLRLLVRPLAWRLLGSSRP